MRTIRVLAAVLLLVIPAAWLRAAPVAPAGKVVPLAALPEQPAHPEKGSSTGLPLPRFVSLATGDVNMRVGPGFQYPIAWVYKRAGLPVVVEREFDVWRLVLAPDGGRGWMHEATLAGTRTFLVSGGDRILRKRPDRKARAVAVLKAGVIGRIRRCKAGAAWCSVVVDGRRGYLRRKDFWGTFPGEAVP
ncbi:MAG: SH3 domain-containing protein [Rhodospirillales bacterium]|nr:SH3 domain-containing protein [Rhodospirillales bacterium]